MNNIYGKLITLQFANLNDKKLIYNMLVSPEVIDLMFDDAHPAPTWQEFNTEPDILFSGSPSEEGNYLLIKINEEVIGTISYTICRGKLRSAELDVWISTTTHLGKGYGVEAINLILEFVHSYYKIKSFIIRPWVKNSSAIKAYKKCGFKETKEFSATDYYSDELIALYGDGDYGPEETINLIYEMK
jgi:RimJ/RimL family protein N-acetyltransferase